MGDLSPVLLRIPSMTESAVAKVRQLEAEAASRPQVRIKTGHIIHGGMYARTIFIPADVLITGVQIKLATMLILQGDVLAYIGDSGAIRLEGYNVLPGSKGRKQAFLALADTYLTMIFPTGATTVEAAEREFTDEFDLLASHRDDCNETVITGE